MHLLHDLTGDHGGHHAVPRRHSPQAVAKVEDGGPRSVRVLAIAGPLLAKARVQPRGHAVGKPHAKEQRQQLVPHPGEPAPAAAMLVLLTRLLLLRPLFPPRLVPVLFHFFLRTVGLFSKQILLNCPKDFFIKQLS